jgi:hypothetical protein
MIMILKKNQFYDINFLQYFPKLIECTLKFKKFQKYPNFFVKETTKLIPKKTQYCTIGFFNILVIKM